MAQAAKILTEHLQLFTPASLEALFLAAGARKAHIQHVRGHLIAIVSVGAR